MTHIHPSIPSPDISDLYCTTSSSSCMQQQS